MASTHAHVPLHVSALQEIPPSPTLTNPDMILPFDERPENFPLLSSARTPSTPVQVDFVSSSSVGSTPTSTRPRGDSDAEVGVATAVALPMFARGSVASTVTATSSLAAYHGYEHGAPLSDIGEEAEEILSRKSRSPSPDRSRDSSKQAPRLRHKKRSSNLSSSSTSSERNEQWDGFDTSHLMSDRVAADIAQARDDVEHHEDAGHGLNSKEVEEELTVLNDRAEKILANARKRLSSMEDNLTKARHSILLSPRSIPNMHELGHQPGGLYRSISQNAHNRKSRGLFPSLKTMGLQHARTGSEMVATTGLKRLSVVPEPRSVSAMDFSPARYGVGLITSETRPSPPSKIVTHSPSSSRSYNSPLHVLSEEGDETPSTIKTSPDDATPTSSSFALSRGLGIHASGAKAQEDLSQVPYESSESSASLHRSSSQASTRSTRELRDQMSEMKSRIADLKSKAQADSLRRRSTPSLRTPSPFLNSHVNGHGAEGWYMGAGPSNYQEHSTTPTGQPRNFSRTPPRQGHERKDSALESLPDRPPPPPQVVTQDSESEDEERPVTPVAARLLQVADTTPMHPSSARTDRNTPNLVNKTTDPYPPAQLEPDDAAQDLDFEEDESFDVSEEDEEQIASNEEEQVYLNEVLEESLHDIAPEVPAIPGEYLLGEELTDIHGEAAERHEDRLDAFDYENMFLHSAMGTYRGDDVSDDSDNDSLVTSREVVRTPTAAYDSVEDEEQDESTASSGEQYGPGGMKRQTIQAAHGRQSNSPISLRGKTTPVQQLGWSPVSKSSHSWSPVQEHSNGRLRTPPRPWTNFPRTRSMETLSSTASYRTAIEGDVEDDNDDDDDDDDDEDEDFHDEILNWGNAPVRHSNGGRPSSYMPSHSVATKAQNVLGWPTPPSMSGPSRHSLHARPQQPYISAGHSRSMSGSSTRSASGRSPSTSTPYNAFAFPTTGPVQPPPSQPLPVPPPTPPSGRSEGQAMVAHQANTEILMESLIKLADPEFSIESTGRSNFADVDKELVLGLLRAVGGVCDGVLRAQHHRRGGAVKELRSRLVSAKDVLAGMAAEQEGLEEILEDDEDAE